MTWTDLAKLHEHPAQFSIPRYVGLQRPGSILSGGVAVIASNFISTMASEKNYRAPVLRLFVIALALVAPLGITNAARRPKARVAEERAQDRWREVARRHTRCLVARSILPSRLHEATPGARRPSRTQRNCFRPTRTASGFACGAKCSRRSTCCKICAWWRTALSSTLNCIIPVTNRWTSNGSKPCHSRRSLHRTQPNELHRALFHFHRPRPDDAGTNFRATKAALYRGGRSMCPKESTMMT